ARRQVALAHDDGAVHRDGGDAPAIEPGATEVILGALDVLDRSSQVGPIVVGWADLVADVDTGSDTTFLAAVSRHQRLHRVAGVFDWVLPDVAAAVERLDRADRRGRLTPRERVRAAGALDAAADLLVSGGQADSALGVRAVADRVRAGAPAPEPVDAVDRLLVAADALAHGDDGGWDLLEAVLGDASPTGTWSGPGPDGRRLGHDLAASAALVLAVRSLLVAERDDGLDLLPTFPPTWFGGGIELHDAPTAWGRLSYGVRWHGPRPAVLWEVEVHEGLEPPVLRAPGLDPTWRSSEPRGEALLAEVAPPEGIDLYRHVPDHPDIDPEMRRPGADPGPPPAQLPEGGSFS
ncbi:MAG: hypothetical protein KDA94_12920, partial [Acidimicrobiales bacterium]|nr:hypothetical protein [Acidimicrobiales bacterium]